MQYKYNIRCVFCWVFLGIKLPKYIKRGLPIQTIHTIHLVQVKFIPDRLLPSIACFRFNLTMLNIILHYAIGRNVIISCFDLQHHLMFRWVSIRRFIIYDALLQVVYQIILLVVSICACFVVESFDIRSNDIVMYMFVF